MDVPIADKDLARRDCYPWRLFGTATSFALFGLGGVLLGAVVFPLLRLLPGSPRARRARARAIVRGSFRLFIGYMTRTGTISYEIAGRERLGRPGQLIVANHPSLIDVVFLLAFAPDAGCVVKSALFRNPFTRGAVREAGYCSNATTAEMIEASVAALEQGQSLIIFPEGTRTRPGQPTDFHRGAASVAIRAARVVTPVFIRVSPTTLTKSEPWYHIPYRRPHWKFRVGADLWPSEELRLAPPPVASRRFNESMTAVFQKDLADDAG
ncbi:MAG: lysophospholipid acyltransferase family protein [Steroidobacteraceae bacterium]